MRYIRRAQLKVIAVIHHFDRDFRVKNKMCCSQRDQRDDSGAFVSMQNIYKDLRSIDVEYILLTENKIV